MFIITMAGLSKRFFDAGFKIPKYQLKIKDSYLFDLSLLSFKDFFRTEKFIFVIRNDDQVYNFVTDRLKYLGIEDFNIFRLTHDTRGQAESAFLALKKYSTNSNIIIFNIDSIRYNFNFPYFRNDVDGYLEVFNGEGNHWSFIQPGDNLSVIKTTEKLRISNFCSNGLYFFKNSHVFLHAFNQFESSNNYIELFVAPLYNILIKDGFKINYLLINYEDMDFSGTPEEYYNLLKKL